MRKIKFRGKRIDNGEWIIGSLFVSNYRAESFIHDLDGWRAVDPETVGEFTGLQDKDDNEGYQDDILDLPIVGYGVIKFGLYPNTGCIETYNVGFYVDFMDEFKNNTYRHELAYWLEKSVICGNTTDNPELLEVHDAKKL